MFILREYSRIVGQSGNRTNTKVTMSGIISHNTFWKAVFDATSLEIDHQCPLNYCDHSLVRRRVSSCSSSALSSTVKSLLAFPI
jgi:hypothetical protein